MNFMECPRGLWSFMWRLGSIEYKEIDKRRIETMEHVYIY
jgi:hypothetical protein